MRHWIVVIGIVGMVAGSPALAPAAEHTGGKSRMITGEVVDVACYVGGGARGEKHRACAEACAKGGGSLGILEDKTNKLYLAVSPKPGGDPKATLMEHIAHKVQVTGSTAMRGGVATIAIQSVKHLSK